MCGANRPPGSQHLPDHMGNTERGREREGEREKEGERGGERGRGEEG